MPIHAVLVLIMGIILWELNAGRISGKGLLCGDQTRIDKAMKWVSAVVFVIQIFLFWNIFFKTGWDVAVIENGARVLLEKGESSG